MWHRVYGLAVKSEMVLSVNQESSKQAKITVQVRLQRPQTSDATDLDRLMTDEANTDPELTVWDWTKIRRVLAFTFFIISFGSVTGWILLRSASSDVEGSPALQASPTQASVASSAITSTVPSSIELSSTASIATLESSAPAKVATADDAVLDESAALSESAMLSENATLSENAAQSEDLPLTADEAIGEHPFRTENIASTPEHMSVIQRSEAQIPVAVTDIDRTEAPQPGFRRVVLTASMERLEPGADLGEQVKGDIARLYFFTELEGFAGQVVKHRWFYQQQLQTEATLTIEDTPWRTYSEKWLPAEQRGAWHIEVVDVKDKVLLRRDFYYQ